MASDLDDSDGSDDSLHRTKIINSAFDSDSFDSDGTIHVEGLVGSATISPSGRDVALASPDGLAIIDLDSPYNAPRRVKSHGMPWLVVDVQWSPFAARDYWVASTANHCCLVWNLNRPDDSSAGAVEHSLRGHRRSITDINFSAHHPDMLATCSVDGYVHCWDLRRPSTPALTFIDWVAGATQVKYNRQDDHVIASSHNRCVHIWDDRKASLPLRTIEAHTSKIYGLDWNRTNSTSLVTCSLDKTIKFWDYTVRGANDGASSFDGNSVTPMGTLGPINEDDVPERIIKTSFPVWRARHTPFGGGLLAMPQNAPGNLYLYDARPSAMLAAEDPATLNDPVAVFPGHGHHKVKEFLWRSRGGIEDGLDNRDFQLVSWGEDNKLRLSRLDGNDLGTVGYQRGRPAPKNLNITRRGASYKTFRILEDIGDYEKRSATMSSLRPGSHRGTVSLPASQGVSRRPSPTPEDDHHHHHHHHHHGHGYSHSQSHHHNNLHRHQQSRHHSHQHPPEPPTKGSSPSLPPPRSLSSSNIMRDDVASPTLTPQRGKFEQRPSWRNPSMRATQVAGAKNPDQSNVQLDWMKGVSMNKRKTSTEPALTSSQEQLLDSQSLDAQRKVSTDSALSSPLQMSTHDASISMSSDTNNEPESIQEEIVRITDKLPRVKWEELDMDNLTLVASLKGPWGGDSQTVFIKVRVMVPPGYPSARSPRFYIENSSLVPEATQEKIAADLFMLTAEYLKRRSNCLLVAFRYLLGEVDLQSSLALLNRALTNPRLVNDESASSSSSDDDDDDVETARNAFLSPIQAIGSEIMIGPMLPLPPPPPPRSCGAVFTRDGRIVTFFLTKAGKASAKIMFEAPSPPTRDELAELEQPVFIGFGKVLPPRSRTRGSSRRQVEGAEWHDGSSSSDESDSSSYSDGSSGSSSSSSSGDSSSSRNHYSPTNLMDPWSTNMGFQRRIVRSGKSDRKRQASEFDDNDSDSLARSGTLDPGLPVGPKSTVAIEDMRPYLPSKRDLARDYAIFGDGADVCQHNARVAEKYGEADLANIWRYAALLLKSDVPLRLASMYDDSGQRKKSILVIAREAVADANNHDTDNDAPDQSLLIPKSRSRDTFSGRVKWGLHPLARDFVDDLFDYFERLADIQMLAMLSCVFGESFEEDSVAYAESHLSKSDTPLPMKAPSFSLDYVPTTRGHFSAAPPPRLVLSGASTPGGFGSGSNGNSMPPAPGAVVYDGSIDPDNDFDDEFDDYEYDTVMWGNGTHVNGLSQNNSYSGGETPPKWLVGSAPNGGSGTGSGMLSSSPLFGAAAGRFLRRGNNAVVSAIAAGIPQTLTTLLSSSPNDRSDGGPVPVSTPPALSRRQSFFDSAPPSQRPSPQARSSYLGANLHGGQAERLQNRQQQPPPQQQQDPLVLHSQSAHRDIPFPTSVSQRLLGVSTSTSPRNTSALGKLSSLSSSPQDQAPIRKRPSPAETIFSNLTAGNLTWAASALFGGGGGGNGANSGGSAGPSTEPGTAATSVSDEGRRREQAIADAAANAVAKGVKAQAEAAASNMVAVDVLVRTYNDHLFDDDGWMVASLLGGKRRRRLYAEYRYAYSELLQVWSEPLARLEVLKFNVLREDAMKAAAARNDDDVNTNAIDADGTNANTSANANANANANADEDACLPSASLGNNTKHDRLLAVRNSGRGLDAVGICEYCELQLEPLEYDSRAALTVSSGVGSKLGGAVGVCRRCRRARSQLRCVYCTEPVDAIYMPCFGCGCASHPRCLRAWYDAGERLCPAGDECDCAEEATSGRIESWTAMQAQLASGEGVGLAHGGAGNVSHLPSTSADAVQQPAELASTKSRGLIAQARRSAHYASSSSSAMLVSPYGQHYHADGEGHASPRGGKNSNRARSMRHVSLSSSLGYYDDPNDVFGNNMLGADSLGRGGSGSGSGSGAANTTSDNTTKPPVTTTTNNTGGGGFWGSNRRSKPASSGLRQQLQQQQMEYKQQSGGSQRQTSMQHDARHARRGRNQEQQQQQQQQSSPHTPETSSQGGSLVSSAGPSGGESQAASSASTSGGGGPLSAARLSLSSRLLRSSALRRQAASSSPSSSTAGDPSGKDNGHEASDSPHASQ
ncbi:WD repeat protein [Sporothrix brasiliensis 5110]|uniref:WD repeat protein n=1 Tax=Sporothrix brasiliensis 5110 TaxID=1398154 RepID=A0A0C2F8G7_9PEZI|nr:WD repeat protein [Sporothrix brasiliensis 5110]KIH87353.1 WD repeat protein [Sporothrix brasiliensis 5110]